MITTSFVSFTFVWKWIRFPSHHISVRSVWPGITGFENWALTALKLDESLSAYFFNIWRTENPYEHNPCNIGCWKPKTTKSFYPICFILFSFCILNFTDENMTSCLVILLTLNLFQCIYNKTFCRVQLMGQ